MGRMQAMGMAEMEAEGALDLHTMVGWQLRSNHYPPVPSEMIAPAVEAIEACREGDFEKIIKTPFPHKDYGNEVPANVIVENFHMEEFIPCDEEEY